MLEIKAVSAAYKKENVLRGATLNVERGELVTLLGANGCGKTTLLKCAVGILRMSSGEVIADRISLSSVSARMRAKKITYLAQDRITPDMTVGQLVLHGRFPHLSYPRRYSPMDTRIALSAMEKMGLAELADRPLSTLSGGMRQTAYIAMALCQNTDYILLDEPTAYLDARNTVKLLSALRSLAKEDKGILAVTHDLQAAMCFSHKVALMSGGRIAAFGTPEKIYSSGMIKELFDIDLSIVNGSYCCDYSRAIKENIGD